MRCIIGLSIIVLGSFAMPALAQPSWCPKWEAGTRYPWQSNEVMRHDRFAWVILKVDRRGYPVQCRVASNNYPDNETRLFLCKQYYELWRGPKATEADPEIRTLARFSFVPGPRHQSADRKARAAWFKQRPNERPECYPEPSRPDRMDL
jgi:hypothetical protein